MKTLPWGCYLKPETRTCVRHLSLFWLGIRDLLLAINIQQRSVWIYVFIGIVLYPDPNKTSDSIWWEIDTKFYSVITWVHSGTKWTRHLSWYRNKFHWNFSEIWFSTWRPFWFSSSELLQVLWIAILKIWHRKILIWPVKKAWRDKTHYFTLRLYLSRGFGSAGFL